LEIGPEEFAPGKVKQVEVYDLGRENVQLDVSSTEKCVPKGRGGHGVRAGTLVERPKCLLGGGEKVVFSTSGGLPNFAR